VSYFHHSFPSISSILTCHSVSFQQELPPLQHLILHHDHIKKKHPARYFPKDDHPPSLCNLRRNHNLPPLHILPPPPRHRLSNPLLFFLFPPLLQIHKSKTSRRQIPLGRCPRQLSRHKSDIPPHGKTYSPPQSPIRLSCDRVG